MIFIPGMLSSAEDYVQEMTSLKPRRCISLSLRGRGKSDAPQSGYSFENHISDIEALVAKLHLKGFCLMGYSVGVAYAVGYAIRHHATLKGLIVGDYPALYPAFGPAWTERVLKDHPGVAQPHAVRAMQKESSRIQLWDGLKNLACPVLVLRGGKEDSLLPADASETYKQNLRDVRIVVLEESGHDLTKPDYKGYICTIKAFLESTDSRR